METSWQPDVEKVIEKADRVASAALEGHPPFDLVENGPVWTAIIDLERRIGETLEAIVEMVPAARREEAERLADVVWRASATMDGLYMAQGFKLGRVTSVLTP